GIHRLRGVALGCQDEPVTQAGDRKAHDDLVARRRRLTRQENVLPVPAAIRGPEEPSVEQRDAVARVDERRVAAVVRPLYEPPGRTAAPRLVEPFVAEEEPETPIHEGEPAAAAVRDRAVPGPAAVVRPTE